MHELLEVVVQRLGGHEVGAGLESCMHAPFAGTEEAAEMQQVLKLIADGRLPGIECKAPSRPQSLADMYKAERTDLLCAREPEKARAEHRRVATETWNSTYNENVPNQIRDLSELRARHKGLHQQYEEEFAAWMEGMEDRPVASTNSSGNASASSSSAAAAAAASTAAVEALQQATEAGAVDGAVAAAAAPAAAVVVAAVPSTTAAAAAAVPSTTAAAAVPSTGAARVEEPQQQQQREEEADPDADL